MSKPDWKSSIYIACLCVFSVACFTAEVRAVPQASSTIDESIEDDESNPAAVQYSEPEEVIWEFGLRFSCHGGQAKGVVAFAPIPIQWQEQDIELIDEIKTDNVGRIAIKSLTKEANGMLFKLGRMSAGETAEAILRYRVRKRNILLPEDKSLLKIDPKPSGRLKAFLKPSPYIESKDKQIRKIAKELEKANESKSDWEKVEANYTWVRENVEYKFDTQIHSCAEALESGFGDCEELSSLFIAICRAQGIPARAVWVPGHTYPEFYLTDDEGNGFWFPCQAAGQNHEFGEMAELRPVIQKGDRFKMPGESEVKRYVQATLFAADATGGLKVDDWIMREVDGSEVENSGDSGSAANQSK